MNSKTHYVPGSMPPRLTPGQPVPVPVRDNSNRDPGREAVDAWDNYDDSGDTGDAVDIGHPVDDEEPTCTWAAVAALLIGAVCLWCAMVAVCVYGLADIQSHAFGRVGVDAVAAYVYFLSGVRMLRLSNRLHGGGR